MEIKILKKLFGANTYVQNRIAEFTPGIMGIQERRGRGFAQFPLRGADCNEPIWLSLADPKTENLMWIAEVFPNLEMIELNSNRYKILNSLDGIQNLKNLKTLNINRNFGLNDLNIENINKTLTEIYLNGGEMNLSNLSPKMNFLYLNGTKISNIPKLLEIDCNYLRLENVTDINENSRELTDFIGKFKDYKITYKEKDLHQEIKQKFKKLIDQYPDIKYSGLHANEDWEQVSFYPSYDYPKAFMMKWGEDWNLKVKKLIITVDKTKNLDWIPANFPNLVSLYLTGSPNIKSLLGIEKLTFLKFLSLEKLSKWTKLIELKNLNSLRKLIIEVNSKDLKIDLNELPEGLSRLYIGQNNNEDLLYSENLDFTRFNNLTFLTIKASQLGNGASFILPSTLKEFCLYKNNSFNNLSMLSTLSQDCKIAIRSLHLSKMTPPKKFNYLFITPDD